MSADYHLWMEETVKGPFTIGQLRGMWTNGQITAETLYTINAEPDWKPLSHIIGELEAIPASPPNDKVVKVLEEINKSQEVTKNSSKFVGCFFFGLFALGCGLLILFFFARIGP